MNQQYRDELFSRIREREDDCVALEDGYIYDWPHRDTLGALSAIELRAIADVLDEKNKPWHDEVTQYFTEDYERRRTRRSQVSESDPHSCDGSL
jgi:hypothetical protein